jgi:hypothetical protein
VRCLFTLLAAVVSFDAATGGAPKFPAPGSVLPGSFQPLNLNGKAKDRPHCLVCEFGLDPVVMVLAREGPDGDDPELGNLLAQLDQAVERHQDHRLHSFAVVLSPAAKNSISQPKIDDTAALLDEAQKREQLLKRLAPLVAKDKLKHVVISVSPEEGPKGYNIPAQPGVSVVLYYKHRVEAHHFFEHGKLQADQIAQVLKNTDEMIQRDRKK